MHQLNWELMGISFEQLNGIRFIGLNSTLGGWGRDFKLNLNSKYWNVQDLMNISVFDIDVIKFDKLQASIFIIKNVARSLLNINDVHSFHSTDM